MSIHRRTDCRLCGGTRLSRVLELEPTPPANAFREAAALNTPQECFPLDLYFCKDCTHVQLCDVVDPAVLFRHYVYVSGTSPAYRKHLSEYASDVLARFSPTAGAARVIEVGSNDGTFLNLLKERGADVLGIDPAEEIGAQANREGIPTIVDFFSSEVGRRLAAEGREADIVVANHVFAHVDDLRGFVEGVTALLPEHGVFIFEVNYLLDIYQQNLFDTIYHEHVAYHSVRALQPFLASYGLEIVEAERTPHQGGSLRVVAQRTAGPHPIGESVATRLREEAQHGLEQEETFLNWHEDLLYLRSNFLAEIALIRENGKRLAGFGAPAKCTTLMYFLGIGQDTIEFIADDNPIKQGLFTPGLNIPVVPASEIYAKRPDVTIVLAWNFADSIIERQHRYVEEGGVFLVPLPTLQTVVDGNQDMVTRVDHRASDQLAQSKSIL